MDAIAIKDISLENASDIENIVDFFIHYIENDYLGWISNLHLAISDASVSYGPNDPRCLKLARLASIAVDFTKVFLIMIDRGMC